MTYESLKVTIAEAKRFVRLAEIAKLRMENDKYLYQSKETATCKRASMDLTRALAEMRKT